MNRAGAVALILLGAILAGCSEELGPEPTPTARVEGSVAIGGVRMRSGWVEFQPVDGTVGKLRSARINPDGSFAVDGVAVGEQAVGLAEVASPPSRSGPSLASSPLFHAGQSLIRRRILPGTTNRIDLDLAGEAETYAKRMQAARRISE